MKYVEGNFALNLYNILCLVGSQMTTPDVETVFIVFHRSENGLLCVHVATLTKELEPA